MDWSDPKAARGILGANVKRLRKAQRLSQERLAELTDLDQPHISEVEAGLINLTLDNVQALAVALGVEPSDLLKPTGRGG
jgi:transcriptional regulator with XRE-family HTH domain